MGYVLEEDFLPFFCLVQVVHHPVHGIRETGELRVFKLHLPRLQLSAADFFGKCRKAPHGTGKGAGNAAAEQDRQQNCPQNDDQHHQIDLSGKGHKRGHIHISDESSAVFRRILQHGDGIGAAFQRDRPVLDVITEILPAEIGGQLLPDFFVSRRGGEERSVLIQYDGAAACASDAVFVLIETPHPFPVAHVVLPGFRCAFGHGLELSRYSRADIAADREIEDQDDCQQDAAGQTDQTSEDVGLNVPLLLHSLSSSRKP